MKRAAIRLSILIITFTAGINVDYLWRGQAYALLAQLSEFHDACIRNDVDYLNRTLPDDFTFTDFRGGTVGKAQWISHFADFPSSIVVEYFYLRGARVSIEEDRATVTGELVDSLRFFKPGESPHSVRHAFQSTYAYEKRGSSWRLISIRLRTP